MGDTVRCKFLCTGVKSTEWGAEQIELTPVWNPDPNTVNYAYWSATPQGRISLTLTNPDAFGDFEEGKEYYVDFRPVA
jgi:hypothetical protein